MNLRNRIFATTAAVVLTASTALTGMAQDTNTSSSSVTIGAGAFTTSLTASNFVNLPYSLTDQFARGGSIILTVSDQTGDNDGWTVTVSLSDFVGQDRPAENIPSENLEITSYTITEAADNSQPVSQPNMVPVTSEVEGQPQLTWTANPGYGAGAYRLNMIADLLIPGRTSAQTYTSTGTVAIVAGP